MHRPPMTHPADTAGTHASSVISLPALISRLNRKQLEYTHVKHIWEVHHYMQVAYVQMVTYICAGGTVYAACSLHGWARWKQQACLVI